MICSRSILGVFASAAIASGLSAQTLDPQFAGVYTLQDLGSVTGVPANYGGMTFLRGDTNTLLLGGAANGGTGRIYAVPLVRGVDGHITGFGTATDYCAGANNDGGLDYAPNGTLFVAQYPLHSIGQVLPGNSSTFDLVTNMAQFGVTGSLGGLLFVPEGQPGEGHLKLLIYNSSRWYDVPFSENPDGTYSFANATVEVQIQGAPEGFVYVPGCSQAFPNPSILVCEFGTGSVTTYDVNQQGDPIPLSRRVFISGLGGAEGAVIDPVTGDFLFGTYGGGNRIVRVDGFPPPLNCRCDWNHVNCVNSQDFFDFLTDFFASNADFNEDVVTNSQDFFDFLSCFFSGCI